MLSQEAELRPRPLGTTLARGELASRECSDLETQGVDLSSRLLSTIPSRGELVCRECSDHWNSGESWTHRSAEEAKRITGGISSRQRQLEHLTQDITRW